MSNLLLSKRSALKHYNLISKYTPESFTQDNLILELKNYRISKSKRNSPTKLKTPTFKTQRLCNTDDFRPVTAEFSCLATVRREKLKKKHERLIEAYRFSIENDKKSLSISSTVPQLRTFLESLQFVTPLKIDIELNAEVVKNKKVTSEKSSGLYGLLIDHMSNESKHPKNSDEILDLLKEYCGVFRDILRTLSDKDADEEVVNLELLWRMVIKCLDSSLLLQETTVNELIRSTSKQIEEITEKAEQDMQEQKSSLEAMQNSLKIQINEQLKTIKMLKRENYFTDKLLKQKEAYICELLEPVSQDQSCEMMRSALKKLSSYITESEIEQIKQVNTLRDLSTIMAVAEEINKGPESVIVSTQTEWNFVESPLPGLAQPVLSLHPLLPFYKYERIKYPESIHSELMQICENCLVTGDGNLEFYNEVLLAIGSSFKTKDKIAPAVVEMVNMLGTEINTAKKLFQRLLKLKGNLDFHTETAVLSLAKSLIPICEGKFIGYGKLIDFLIALDEDRKIIENLLQSLDYYNGTLQEDRFSSLIFRLYHTLSKTKTLDSLPERSRPDDFKDFLKNTANWFVSEPDLNYFLTNLSLEADFNAMLTSAANKLSNYKVDKNSVLLGYLKEISKKVKTVEVGMSNLWEEENIDKFIENARNMRKDCNDKNLRLGYVWNMMEKSRSEILIKLWDYDFYGNRLPKGTPVKKKPPAKKAKNKK